MDQTRLDRINALARKAREEGLTDEELWEQKMLRQEYVAAWRNNLETVLENTYVVDGEGNKSKLRKKTEHADEGLCEGGCECGCGCEEEEKPRH